MNDYRFRVFTWDMVSYSIEEINHWDRFYRANFLACASGYKPAMLVGTVDVAGRHNLALFQNVVHLGANPALIGIINRPREATRDTLVNIEAAGCFTLNAVQENFTQQAHQTSARYDTASSEFDAVGLTPEFVEGFGAPFVKESHLRLGMTLEEIVPIRQNGTFLIIGAVQCVQVSQEWVQQDGFIRLQDAGVVCTIGLDGYARPSLLHRLSYAKPGQDAQEIQ